MSRVRLTAEDYAAQLRQLLPQGWAWPDDPGAVLQRLLAGFGGALSRTHDRALALLREAHPETALELLPEWEREVGEPDDCAGPAQGLQLRRQRVVQKLTARGGQSRQFYVELAASLGYEIEIREYRPFVCGLSQAALDVLAGTAEVRFVWSVFVLGPRVTWFRAGASQAGLDPLARIDRAEDLECMLQRAAPAHTLLIVGYTDPRLLEVGGVRLTVAGRGIRVG